MGVMTSTQKKFKEKKFVFDQKNFFSKQILLPIFVWPLCFDNNFFFFFGLKSPINWVWEPKARVPSPPQVLEWRSRSDLKF